MDKIVNSTPKITVLMPVYNCELYIKEAVESILNQTCSDFEFLIIDDASTDKTVSIIKSYQDSRIQLIEKPLNTGLTNSLNLGLRLARGKYIARMDGDDISVPERFAKQITFLEANPDVVLCGAWFNIVGSNKLVKVPEHHDAIKLALLRGNCIAHPTVMMRKEILDEFSISYEEQKEAAEDYDLWVRLLMLGKLHNLQEVLLGYRMHNAQVSSKRMLQQNRITIATRLKLLNALDYKMDVFEIDVLKKIISEEEIIEFSEIELFQQLQKKMISSNQNFFDAIGFHKYMYELENRGVEKYFLSKKEFTPLTYFQYLKIKKRINQKLATFSEFKLLMKSLIFYKAK
jgi:glycosyltransferase involved in cell wall biosynthesis